MTDLTSKRCKPCEGGTPALTAAAVAELRKALHADWQLSTDDASQVAVRHLQFKRGTYVVDYRLERIDGETHMVIDYDTKVEGR